jgi:multimeric flavodoxin WrbA
MKILGINGSPRKGGNTDILLDLVLQGASECRAGIEKIWLEELVIHPCREEEYYSVDSRGLSPVKDDMHVVYEKVEECDVLLVASPIFFGSLSAQTKAMIDRFQCIWVAKNFKKMEVFTRKKLGAFLCVEATHREDFFQNAKFIIKNFFHIINVRYSGELFCPGLEEKAAVKKFPEFLERAFQLGRTLINLVPG